MIRFLTSCGVLLLSAALLVAAPAPEKEPPPVIALAKKLAKPVKFPGWEKDDRLKLCDALDQLKELYGLNFTINEAAFRVETPPFVEVHNTPVVDKESLPAMRDVLLETILRRVLARVPTTSGATFTIRQGEIEITTGSAQRVEFWGERYGGPFLPLIHAAFERRPLEEALKELANSTDFNIMVDARVAEKAKTPVTAQLSNVPLDTAVRLLADMADLKPFLVDNVLYVTSRENAAKLEAEEKVKAESASGPRVGAGRTVQPPPPPLLP